MGVAVRTRLLAAVAATLCGMSSACFAGDVQVLDLKHTREAMKMTYKKGERVPLPRIVVFDGQRRLQHINVVRQICNVAVHDRRESHSARVRQPCLLPQVGYFSVHPAASGRQVCRGFRQSIPSSM